MQKNNRLILLDLDGTTLQANGTSIHPRTIDAVKKASKAGHKICIITARPHRAAFRFYNQLGLDTLLTNFDGAYIHDPIKKVFKRFSFTIAYDVVSQIINDEELKPFLDNILIENYNTTICWKNNSDYDEYFHLDNIFDDEYRIADPYTNWNMPANNMALAIKKNSDNNKIIHALYKYRNAIRFSFKVIGKTTTIVITNKLVSKGFTTQILAQNYNVNLSDVIAFGDDTNDIEMISNVGYGIAMKNGVEQLKINARDITNLTNDEGGVGEYLDNLLTKL